MKPSNAHKCVTLPYITNIIFLLHVSATLVAILREMHYKGWACQDITEVCKPMHICKILSFNNTWFKIYSKCEIQIKMFVINSNV
jgi:hypothetical protein